MTSTDPPMTSPFSPEADPGFPNRRRRFTPLRFLGFAALVVLCVLVYGFATEALWNWLVPSIFHLRRVTFWEAAGLVLLGKLLFGGFHRHGKGRRGGGPGRRGWGSPMRERFARMSPEERDKFRAGMRGSRWTCRPTRTESAQGDLS